MTNRRETRVTSPDYNDLTDFDLLQLIGIDAKRQSEGSLSYTCENWGWNFDSRDLNDAFADAEDGDVTGIRQALDATHERREQWWRDNWHPTRIAPLDAHEAEAARRAKAALAKLQATPE
jgi:hypothetical protein